MDNIELEQKIKEIIATDNYFDLKIKAKEFEKDYKSTEFYKTTKIPLDQVINEARTHYAYKLEGLGDKIQSIINNLSMDNINDILDKIGQTFGQENQEIGDLLQDIKDLR